MLIIHGREPAYRGLVDEGLVDEGLEQGIPKKFFGGGHPEYGLQFVLASLSVGCTSFL